MQKRHTLHGAARTARPISSRPPGDSGTRLRSATGVEDSIQASIEFAMAELDALEVPYTASAPPLAAEPAQQMPRGMPPLPFRAPHPRNMPPLPAPSPSAAARPRPAAAQGSEVSTNTPGADAAARPSRWLLFVALGLGVVCIALAFWLQLVIR
jgi:hypothetical protein